MKSKTLFIDTLTTGSGMVFFQLSNFLLGIFIVRVLGVAELGNYQFFVATATFMSYFAKMGADECLSYTLPALGGIDRPDGAALVKRLVKQALILSLLVACGYVFFAWVLSGPTKPFVFWPDGFAPLIYLPSFVGLLLLVSVLRAEQRMLARALFLYVLPNLFNFVLILLLFAFAGGEGISIIARSVSYLVLFIVSLWLIGRRYHLWGNNILPVQGGGTKILDSNSLWLMITVLSFVLESGVLALWYAKYALSPEDVGIFAVLLRLAGLVMLVPTALTLVYGPVLAKQLDSHHLRRLFLLNTVGVLFVTFLLSVFPQWWLGFFGSMFRLYAFELKVLLGAVFVLSVSQPLYSVLLAERRGKELTVVGVLSVLTMPIFLFIFKVNNLSSLVYAISGVLVAYSMFRGGLYLFIRCRKNYGC